MPAIGSTSGTLQSSRNPPQLQFETGVQADALHLGTFGRLAKTKPKRRNLPQAGLQQRAEDKGGADQRTSRPMRKRIWAGGKRKIAITILSWVLGAAAA
jgi:hypothetical protein